MKPEKQQLIHDLLDDEGRQEATLMAATRVLRRRRQWRVAWRTFALLMLATATALLVQQKRKQTLAQVSPANGKPSEPPQVQSLTDEQLLSLFPNTPVGLATLPNGKKLLIFPRPADEAKYVTRL